MYTHPTEIHLLLRMVTDYLIEFMASARRLLPRPVSSNFLEIYLPADLGVGVSDDLAPSSRPPVRGIRGSLLNQLSDAFGGLFLHSCGNPNMKFCGYAQYP